MKFIYLALAIIFEVIGSGFMQASAGFTKWVATSIMAVSYLLCFYFLAIALKFIPLGIAYAIWGGVGIVLTAAVGVIVFKQKLDFGAIAGIALIVAGVFVLNFFSKSLSH